MSLSDCCACVGASLLGLIIFAISMAGVALGIADIVIGAKWDNCHLSDDDADVYLIVLGCLSILCFLFTGYSSSKGEEAKENAGRGSLVGLAFIGVLIWGMTIFWDSDQLDCSSGQYDYGYYRTVVTMFFLTAVFGLLIIGGMIAMCAA